MVALNENFWNIKGDDGRSRNHVPPMPFWVAIIRIVQLVMALLILILAAVAGSKIGSGHASLGITFFTFAWTILHLGWLAISILVAPTAYNYWAQLAVESLTVIFWLASWAALAAQSTALILLDDGFRSLSGQLKIFNEGLDLMKASAGLGALEWILFIVTLVFFIISLINFRKANKATGGITGTEAAVAEAKPLGPGYVEMAPVPVVSQQPVMYQDQPPQMQPGQVYSTPYPQQQQQQQ